MNIFQHVLLSFLVVLVSYLVWQNQQLTTTLNQLAFQQAHISEEMGKTLQPLAKQLDSIQASMNKLGAAADDSVKQKLQPLQIRLSLYKTLGVLQQAEQLRTEGKGAEAADKLQTTKDAIWKAGDALEKYKKRLQDLMAPIDGLVAKWKGGDTKTAADAIRKEIETILGELSNE